MSAAVTTRPDEELSSSTGTITYRYRSGRVTIGTFYFLIGAAFLMDSLGLLRVDAALLWSLLLIAIGVGMLLRRARRLQVEEDRSAQLAVAEERVRIARELHDIVAHGVSLMTIQIAAARRVADSKPDAAESSLAAAEQTGRQTLSELDSMLSVLRGADASIGAASGPVFAVPQPFEAPPVSAPRGPSSDALPGDDGAWRPARVALPALASSGAGTPRTMPSPDPRRAPLPRLADVPGLVTALQEAGRRVTLHVLGDPPQVPASVELVVYRVVQEALTNAARYAGDAAIDVQLIYAPHTITVFVDDDGPGSGVVGRPGGGHGLLGMSERLATFGGSLEAGPRSPGPGWRVYATIPVLAIAA